MKSIVIVVSKMEMGGCEKSLISMLKVIPKNKYKITLYVRFLGGELIDKVPEWVIIKQVPNANISTRDIVLNNFKNRKIITGLKSAYYLMLLRKKGYNEQLHLYCKSLPKIEEKFDLAISCAFPAHFPDWYVIENINAKKKITWVHSDVTRLKGTISDICNEMYMNFDKIFCVCEDVKDRFIESFPNTKNKVDIFYNIIDSNNIISKAINHVSFEDNYNGLKILTVGRLAEEKGQHLIPIILSKLLKQGLDVRWYCVGDGHLKEKLKELILEYKLENNLILLGSKDNPYSYMRDCDIYVQPSKYEGYCTTVEEARCFNKPIIMTNCAGAKEQVLDGETGFIVNYNENELYEKIKLLINNKELRKWFGENCKNKTIDSTNEIKKVYKLLN